MWDRGPSAARMEKEIRQALHQNSGGMKMVELICELMLPFGLSYTAKEFLHQIYLTIDKMPDVEILRYQNNSSIERKQILREKEFVYFKAS